MHSQPAVLFKRKTLDVAVTGCLTFGLLILSILSFRNHSGPWATAGILLGVITILLAVRLFIALKKPYLDLTDNRVTVYNGLLPKANHYSLEHIQGAHTNRPETYIELLGREDEKTVRIDLHPLDKADRIRFIFLVESSINRKFSHRHR
ncbi:hypothetical protein JW777_11125 [bacterium]|nr:hypothetical protein [bacterium]